MDVEAWLLSSDPAIRWQVMRDIVGANATAVEAERARVAHEGWGRELLHRQGHDGLWHDPAEPPWVANFNTMVTLTELGVDAADAEVQRRLTAFDDAYRWDEYFGAKRFFQGEIEACINGRVLSAGVHFGRADSALAQRLIDDQLDDGGWNCYAPPSVRSSFHSTICVLEGLLAYERSTSATDDLTRARQRGEEYLLERSLYRRRSKGQVADTGFLEFQFPSSWHYDVLRGLDYFCAAGAIPHPRLAEGIDIVRARRTADGRWMLDRRPAYEIPLTGSEQPGHPSKAITLRALRVLEWWDSASP